MPARVIRQHRIGKYKRPIRPLSELGTPRARKGQQHLTHQVDVVLFTAAELHGEAYIPVDHRIESTAARYPKIAFGSLEYVNSRCF